MSTKNAETKIADTALVGTIRTTTRTMYDLQKMRIQIGNRVAGQFRVKLGMSTSGMSKEELEEAAQNMLARLESSYKRITDGIVAESGDKRLTRVMMERKFQPDDLITDVGELFLMDNYMKMLENEEQHAKDIERLLKKMPIWTDFLEGVQGIGPMMAGVLISEIDIHKAEYPSSLWKLSGIDVVDVVQCKIGEKILRWSTEQAMEEDGMVYDPLEGFTYKGTPCEVIGVGRNNHSYCLVKRAYTDKNGNEAVRNSITYNPFLKTKLLGVMASGFIKSSGIRIEGKLMGAAKRIEFATSKGFNADDVGDEELNDEVLKFLKSAGFRVEDAGSPYAKIYHDERRRLDNHIEHASLQKIVKHRRALRKMVKQFLVDFYNHYRKLEGLPVAAPYHEAKLGKIHGKAAEPGWEKRGRHQ